MSASTEIVSNTAPSLGNNWSLWIRQVAAILRLEVRKNFLGKRAILIYLIAASPIMLMAALSAEISWQQSRNSINIGETNIIFANLYEGMILRTIVFFGCAWIFMNLFRGEVVDRSLHYYFLSPVRREVLVVGKYVSGLIASMVIFTISTAGSLVFLYIGLGSTGSSYFWDGAGKGQALGYLGITVLACVGYGAVFMVIGLLFRNPIIPALLIYGWEWINFLLPPVLKKISVIHYLHSLAPVPVPEGPFAMPVEPTPAYLSIPGLLVMTAIVLAIASYQIRRMEIKYGGE
jgi:ABC-type transport system involved in multi-copper enzyme maturation permease subunit